jgi:hypothetical protein
MEARVAYKKGKVVHELPMWIVSRYTEPMDIINKDAKTMRRLNNTFYGNSYKGKRMIMVRSIESKLYLGRASQ